MSDIELKGDMAKMVSNPAYQTVKMTLYDYNNLVDKSKSNEIIQELIDILIESEKEIKKELCTGYSKPNGDYSIPCKGKISCDKCSELYFKDREKKMKEKYLFKVGEEQ